MWSCMFLPVSKLTWDNRLTSCCSSHNLHWTPGYAQSSDWPNISSTTSFVTGFAHAIAVEKGAPWRTALSYLVTIRPTCVGFRCWCRRICTAFNGLPGGVGCTIAKLMSSPASSRSCQTWRKSCSHVVKSPPSRTFLCWSLNGTYIPSMYQVWTSNIRSCEISTRCPCCCQMGCNLWMKSDWSSRRMDKVDIGCTSGPRSTNTTDPSPQCSSSSARSPGDGMTILIPSPDLKGSYHLLPGTPRWSVHLRPLQTLSRFALRVRSSGEIPCGTTATAWAVPSRVSARNWKFSKIGALISLGFWYTIKCPMVCSVGAASGLGKTHAKWTGTSRWILSLHACWMSCTQRLMWASTRTTLETSLTLSVEQSAYQVVRYATGPSSSFSIHAPSPKKVPIARNQCGHGITLGLKFKTQDSLVICCVVLTTSLLDADWLAAAIGRCIKSTTSESWSSGLPNSLRISSESMRLGETSVSDSADSSGASGGVGT